MARPRNTLPSYQHHKTTGQARAYIDGRDYYLGLYGSDESRRRFGELIARHAAGLPLVDPLAQPKAELFGSTTEKPQVDPGPSVAELIVAFKAFADAYYLKPDGTPTAEIDCLESAIRPLRELYGLLPISEFTPLMLKAVRERFIAKGWSRGFCNKSTNRIRHIFKWGVENGMVRVETLRALQCVSPLMAGRCKAPDHKRREAVCEADIEKVRRVLRQKNRDMLDLMLLIGCRPGELLSLSWSMIDKSKAVWVAELIDHKTAYKGKSRRLFIGPKAQVILTARYADTPPAERIFPTRRDVFSRVLQLACERAKVTPFVPHQLRHSAATRIRDQFGIEHAQATLGHAQPSMTAHYSSRLDGLAETTAAAVG